VLLKYWPSIRVHCWGGLGSQLFALNFIFDVRNRFPKKSFILNQHTSGFTHRSADLNFLDLDFVRVKEIDDFDFEFNSLQSSSDKSNRIRIFIKSLLNFTGFYLFEEHLSKKTKIYKRTIAIRGSYSSVDLDKKFLEYLVGKLKEMSNRLNLQPNTVAIHYRLGDLLDLQIKPIAQPEEIKKLISLMLKNNPIDSINVYSDSIGEARKRLDLDYLGVSVNFINCSPMEVINRCFHADYFIGTGSKVSFWVLKLRNFEGFTENSFIVGSDI
jgi:hypothetical protein